MKTILIFILGIAFVYGGTVPVLSSETVNEQWENFKVTYEKHYDTVDEEIFRKQVFVEKLQFIEEHNSKFKEGLTNFTVGINYMADFTMDEFSDMTNCVTEIDEDDDVPLMLVKVTSTDSAPPASKDWRKDGFMTPVKDQVGPTCWAYAGVGAIEAQYKIKQKKENTYILSEQQLIDCWADVEECGGAATLPCVYLYSKIKGLELNEEYQSKTEDPKCNYQPDKVKLHTTGYVKIPSSTTDKKAWTMDKIASIGPVTATLCFTDEDVNVFDAFKSAEVFSFTGDCDKTTAEKYLHAVVVAGYYTSEKENYWLIKNSYGTTWGDQGYMKLSMDEVKSGHITRSIRYPLL
ncbi:hypothetical protein Zmor_027295 [Zophobas morio]|uniref:Cathepsin L n=1 Tax=Zophobas morio TaxID=2755281 RepID=A0AA38HQB9_9CUCU|nr:hypothetical protein Zmor_027295 [Zophobas morio]